MSKKRGKLYTFGGRVTIAYMLLTLAACGPERVRIALPPAELATCAEEPQAPALPGRDAQVERDRLTLDYVLALRSAGGDCRAKVAGLRAWREAAE